MSGARPAPNMRGELRNAVVATVLMIAAAVLAWLIVPTHKLIDTLGKLDLETSIPREFGDWTLDPHAHGGVVNPQLTEALSAIYSQTLSRTYVNRRNGARIMLSVAYGEDQRDNSSLHYPEVCYPAQGFQVESNRERALRLQQGVIPARQLETVLGPRREPVTYWTTIGEKTTLGGIDKKLTEMEYSLRGQIPDGLLFRVSSIGRDSVEGFKLQEGFVQAIIDALPAGSRRRFSGLN